MMNRMKIKLSDYDYDFAQNYFSNNHFYTYEKDLGWFKVEKRPKIGLLLIRYFFNYFYLNLRFKRSVNLLFFLRFMNCSLSIFFWS